MESLDRLLSLHCSVSWKKMTVYSSWRLIADCWTELKENQGVWNWCLPSDKRYGGIIAKGEASPLRGKYEPYLDCSWLSSLCSSKSISTFCICLVKKGRIVYWKSSNFHIGFSVLSPSNLLKGFVIFCVWSIPWIGQLPEPVSCHFGKSWICRENLRRCKF